MAFSSNLYSKYNSFEVFISNHEIENKLTDNEPHSSASHFENILNLDLIPLIFLKSTNAKIALQQLSIDSLALCYLSTENIKITVTTPTNINECNHIITTNNISNWNNQSLLITFSDFSATNNQECINHINSMLEDNLTSYLIFRLSLNFFDMNVFKDNIFENTSADNKVTLSKDDLEILLHYVNLTLYTRRQLTAVLEGQPKIEESKLTANFTSQKSLFNQELEEAILSKSLYLLNQKERNKMLENHIFTTLNIDQFYNIDLTKENLPRKALDVKITTSIHDYIGNILEWDLDQPTDTDQTNITSYKTSNNNLIKQGLTLQHLILLQRQKQTGNFDANIFHTDLLTLKLDHTGSKTRFIIANKSFLPNDDTTIEFIFGPKATYTLGGLQTSELDQNLRLGPLSHKNNCSTQTKTKPQLTNHILAENQRLHGPIRYKAT